MHVPTIATRRVDVTQPDAVGHKGSGGDASRAGRTDPKH